MDSCRGKEHLSPKLHLEPSLPVAFGDAVILAGAPVEAVADVQDGGEQGAADLIADFDGQLDRLCGEERPCEETVTCGTDKRVIQHECKA